MMVVKNEVDRYLEDCINWNHQFLDRVFVYDDGSTDATVEMCKDLGCVVVSRPDDSPSFLEHEGKFRHAAWRAFEQAIHPRLFDWVYAFDADEFLVSNAERVAKALKLSIASARKSHQLGVILPFQEVFQIHEGQLYVRVDGLWRTVRGPRLFQYREGALWSDKPMGCGAEPSYVSKGRLSTKNYGLNVIHLGYARDEDKRSKYDRYSSLAVHGHNDSHIKSIVKKPTLKLWEGQVPTLS